MKLTMRLVGLGILIWIILAAPSFLANTFWSDDSAPWEQVDAFYYPDAKDLSVWKTQSDVGSIEACRKWVGDVATQNGDSSLMRGDYECGVACKNADGFNVCRLTID